MPESTPSAQPPIIAELFDGTELEFPAGTSKDVIARVAREQTAKIKSRVGPGMQAIQGFNQGLMETLRAPVDLIQRNVTGPVIAGVESLFSDKPYSAIREEQARRLEQNAATERGLFYPDEPQTAGERIARSAGQAVGMNAPATALTLGLAPTAAALPQAGTAAGRALQGLLTTVAENPATTTALETASAAGSGAGAETAHEIFPDSEAAPVVGGLLGGLVPSAAPAVASRGVPAYLRYAPTPIAARILLQRFRPDLAEKAKTAGAQAAMPQVAAVLRRVLTPDAVSKMHQADAVAAQVPGLNLSLAEKIGNPSLVRTQQALEAAASGPELDMLAQRRALNAQAVDRFEQANRPAGPAFPATLEAAQNKIASTVSNFEDSQNALGASVPTADLPTVGENLRAALNTARRAVSDEFTARATRLGIGNQDVTNEFMKWAGEALPSGRKAFEDTANLPPVLDELRGRYNAILDAVESGDPKALARVRLTYNDMKRLRERISDDQIDSLGAANPSAKRIRALTGLKSQLDGFLDELPFGDAYRQFRKDYAQQYVNRFENAAALKIRQRDARAFYQTADEAVADAFFKADSAQDATRAARQFKTIYGDDPQALANLQAAAIDDFRRAAVRDGQINPALAQAWLRRHETTLKEFPQIEVSARTLATRAAELAQRRATIEDSALNQVLKSYGAGNRTADSVLDSLLKDPRKMGQLVGQISNNDEAMAGLRRAVWDAGTAQKTDVEAFLNNPSVKLVLSADHRAALKTAFDAREMATRVLREEGRPLNLLPGLVGAIEDNLHMTIPQLASRAFAITSGRSSLRYQAVETLVRAYRGFSKDDAARLFKEALYNPEVARDVADYFVLRKSSPQLIGRLHTWLFNLGAADQPTDEQKQ